MLAKIEKFGDRLLGLVVPQARASAACNCARLTLCSIKYDTYKWRCCNQSGCYNTGCGYCPF
jgi:hypothetical protein